MKKIIILLISLSFFINIFCNKVFIYNKSDKKILLSVKSVDWEISAGAIAKIFSIDTFTILYGLKEICIDVSSESGVNPLYIIDVANNVPFVLKIVEIHVYKDIVKSNKHNSIIELCR